MSAARHRTRLGGVGALAAAAIVALGADVVRAAPAPETSPEAAQPAPDAALPAPDDAQPAPAAPPRTLTGPATLDPNTKPPDVITPPPGFESDSAWSVYDSAFRDAAAGDAKLAKSRLAELAERWPGHPAETQASTLLGRGAARPRTRGNKVARGELVFWSTLGGASLAMNLCAAIGCESDREYAAVYTLSIGGALAASLLATRSGVQQGEAQLYNSAQTWGAWNALLINDGFADDAGSASVAMAMQVGGLAVGIGLWHAWHPTQGDVALTNSFLLWGSLMTVWGHLAADEAPSLRTIVIAGDLALGLGALVSRELEMSRARTLLLDIGGILGTLTGGLVGFATGDRTAGGVALLLGTGAGLGLALLATDGWDKPAPVKVSPSVIPGPSHTLGYGISAGFAF